MVRFPERSPSSSWRVVNSSRTTDLGRKQSLDDLISQSLSGTVEMAKMFGAAACATRRHAVKLRVAGSGILAGDRTGQLRKQLATGRRAERQADSSAAGTLL